MRVAFILLAVLASFGCSSVLRTTLPFNDLPGPEGPYAVGTQDRNVAGRFPLRGLYRRSRRSAAHCGPVLVSGIADKRLCTIGLHHRTRRKNAGLRQVHGTAQIPGESHP